MNARVRNSVFWPQIGVVSSECKSSVTIKWPSGAIGVYTKSKGEIEWVRN